MSNIFENDNYYKIIIKLRELCDPINLLYILKYYEEIKELSTNLSIQKKLNLQQKFECIIRNHYGDSKQKIFDTIFNDRFNNNDDFILWLYNLYLSDDTSRLFYYFRQINNLFIE